MQPTPTLSHTGDVESLSQPLQNSPTPLAISSNSRSSSTSNVPRRSGSQGHQIELRSTSTRGSLRGPTAVFDGYFEQGRKQDSNAYHRVGNASEHSPASTTEDRKTRRSSLRQSLRDRLAKQAQQIGLFNLRKPWTDREGSPTSSRSMDAPTGLHFRTPLFNASRAAPFLSTPAVSPFTMTPGGQQRGFFDFAPIERGSSPGFSPLTLYEALQSSPMLTTPARPKDLFRVSLFGEKLQSNEEYVNQLPDHLPTSPLCPRHPKNKSRGRGRCPLHGRNRTSQDSLSEEEEPVIRHKKDLKFFL